MKRALLVVGVALAALAALSTMVAAPAQADPTFGRQSGADRFGTAAAISSVAYPDGADVVFLASGTSFPDALGAAPYAAANHAPILLVQRTVLPGATATELDRLNPKVIVVVGGTAAVSDAVVQAASKYASNDTRRIAGADRYDTAVKVSNGFTGPVPLVYVASGTSFPDALAGGAAIAGTTGGPLLLVQPGAIPQPVKEELTRLKPTDIVVLGGSSAVSDAVVAELKGYSTNLPSRKAGSDRYATAVQVSGAFATAPKVYLATGDGFPDALAGSAVAGAVKGPVLLVHEECIPFAVNVEITRLNPSQVLVLGGTSVISDAVKARTVCAA